MSAYKTLLLPLLFSLDPEEAHNLGQRLLPAFEGLMGVLKNAYELTGPLASNLTTELGGCTLKNPIGLAAGFDKNGKLVNSLAALGFGFIEVGSVTARPCAGNPRPRLFRLPQDRALINRLGLNGEGAQAVYERLKRQDFALPVALNIAKSNYPDVVMQKAAEDIAFSFNTLKELPFTYVTINTSCPNTHDGALFGSQELTLILKSVTSLNTKGLPLFLKLSPDSPPAFIESLLELARQYQINGFVLGNTTISREALLSPPDTVAAIGAGGLSGAPLLPGTKAQVKAIAAAKQPWQQIIACGGISEATDIRELLQSGASAVQLYTALVYEGPTLILSLLRALSQSS